MRIRILVFALLAALVVTLGLPAAIGWLVHDWIAAGVADRLPGARLESDRGWFRSAATLEGGGLRARASFRHLPLDPPGWMVLDGRVVLDEPAVSIDARARLALNGALSLRAEAPALEMPGPVTWRYRAPKVAFASTEENGFELDGSAESLLIVDGLGNRLAFDGATLSLTVDPAPDRSVTDQLVNARLEIEARRVGQPGSRLVLRLESVDLRAIEELAVALSQLASSEAESAGSRLAAIGLASAWQQLVSAGLVIALDELALDDRLALSGRWSPDEKRFSLTGEGARATTVDWWASITGLVEQVRPAKSRQSARRALDGLAEQGVVTSEDGLIMVDARSLPAGD